jgi:hypothetical protein
MNYEFIGWCKEGNHDKVWGVICLQEPEYRESLHGWVAGKYLTFWGRRGAKLQTKLVVNIKYEVEKLCSKKLDKGYKKIHKDDLDKVYPEFETDLEKTAIWATLKI